MPALTIRGDMSSVELRRQARRESDGRVSAPLIAIANALEIEIGPAIVRVEASVELAFLGKVLRLLKAIR